MTELPAVNTLPAAWGPVTHAFHLKASWTKIVTWLAFWKGSISNKVRAPWPAS